MKYIFCLALLAGLMTGLTGARAKGLNAVDSVGVEKVGGKIFIIHKVNQGQTMFAVVRQYGTTIHALREANPGISDQIQSGQTIRVPYTPKVAKKDAKKEDKKEEKKGARKGGGKGNETRSRYTRSSNQHLRAIRILGDCSTRQWHS